jgi:hypothetical protein
MKNVDLKVPYAEKDAAKALGAWWSQERRCWFVPGGVPLEPFANWLPAGAWLVNYEKAGAEWPCSSKKPARELSMSPNAIRTREKKARTFAATRKDSYAAKVAIGSSYIELDHDCSPFEICERCKPVLAAAGWTAARALAMQALAAL